MIPTPCFWKPSLDTPWASWSVQTVSVPGCCVIRPPVRLQGRFARDGQKGVQAQRFAGVAIDLLHNLGNQIFPFALDGDYIAAPYGRGQRYAQYFFAGGFAVGMERAANGLRAVERGVIGVAGHVRVQVVVIVALQRGRDIKARVVDTHSADCSHNGSSFRSVIV